MIPKIIIVMDGGLIQDILVDRQAEVFVVDRDVEGVDQDSADVRKVLGEAAYVSRWGVIMPTNETREEYLQMSADIEEGGFHGMSGPTITCAEEGRHGLSTGDWASWSVPDRRWWRRLWCWLLRKPPPKRVHRGRVARVTRSTLTMGKG